MLAIIKTMAKIIILTSPFKCAKAGFNCINKTDMINERERKNKKIAINIVHRGCFPD